MERNQNNHNSHSPTSSSTSSMQTDSMIEQGKGQGAAAFRKHKLQPAGDPSVIYTNNKIKQPESFISTSKNPTINLLERIIQNQKQMDGEDYVARQPKYLFNVQGNQKIISKQAQLAEIKRQKTKAFFKRPTKELSLRDLQNIVNTGFEFTKTNNKTSAPEYRSNSTKLLKNRRCSSMEVVQEEREPCGKRNLIPSLLSSQKYIRREEPQQILPDLVRFDTQLLAKAIAGKQILNASTESPRGVLKKPKATMVRSGTEPVQEMCSIISMIRKENALA